MQEEHDVRRKEGVCGMAWVVQQEYRLLGALAVAEVREVFFPSRLKQIESGRMADVQGNGLTLPK